MKAVSSTTASGEEASPLASSSRLLRDLKTLPNLLSLSRFVLIAIAIVLYINGYRVLGLIFGVCCGVSDYLDGYVARRRGAVTELGSVLDRLGDLVFEMWAFTFAIYVDILSPYLFMAYVLREVVVMSARQYVSEHRVPGVEMTSSFFGKLKTNFFGYSFLLMFLVHAQVVPNQQVNEILHHLSVLGVVLGLLWSYISGLQYLRTFVQAYDRR